MRSFMDTVRMDGTVVIGEGEKDEAPMLFNGESVGDGNGPEVDVAGPDRRHPLTALGYNNALAVFAVAEKGACTTLRRVLHGEDGGGRRRPSTWTCACRSSRT